MPLSYDCQKSLVPLVLPQTFFHLQAVVKNLKFYFSLKPLLQLMTLSWLTMKQFERVHRPHLTIVAINLQ